MPKIDLTIDGIKVEAEEGKNLLDAALDSGIYIPNLCHHPALKPIGACGLCVVEIEGRSEVVRACTTTIEAGMVAHTKTAKVLQLRRLSVELMLAEHPEECTSCPKYGNCTLQSLLQYVGASNGRLRATGKPVKPNNANPLFVHDMFRCVKCGRCVRACRDMRGVKVLDYQKDAHGVTLIGSGKDLLADADCRFCGACVEVCPTSAIRDKEGLIRSDVPHADALVPCRTACPAHTDAPRYVRYIREGKYSEAVAVIREKVPFPMVLGYVCNHVCESPCRRRDINGAVSIRNLKRFAAEHDDGAWKQKSVRKPATGKKVAVVGAGPAGLTAAYYLAKQGHEVTVFEAQAQAGGMMRYGIPDYRLPTEVVAKEIDEITAVGVQIKTNTRITSADELLKEGYSTVLLAIGAHEGVKLPIPGNDLDGVLTNIPFLRRARMGEKMDLGGKVAVLGGGPVAFDCARVARRMGAGEVHIACLETREGMTADEEEIQQGQEEGILIHPAKTFLRILGEGRVSGVELQDIKSFTFDENKHAILETTEGSEHTIAADTVIFAVGQRPEGSEAFGIELGRGRCFDVDKKTLSSGKPGIYAAGDAVTGTVSVIEAIAGGRKAAEEIDKYLGGDGDISEILAPVEEPKEWIGKEEGFALRQREKQTSESSDQRVVNCSLVDHTFEEASALRESGRCLQCDLRARIVSPKFWGEFQSRRKGEQ